MIESKTGEMSPIFFPALTIILRKEAFGRLRPAYSVKLGFSYVVKGIKIKITASKHRRFKDKNRIGSPEMRPKSFGTFEKRAPGFQ